MIDYFFEIIKQALAALSANKVRTFLTLLGVLIGVFAVITMVTIGEGAKSYVYYQVSSMGNRANSFAIGPGVSLATIPAPKFTYGDIAYIKANVPEITGIIGLSPNTGDIYYEDKRFRAPLIIGTTANYAELMEHKMIEGTFFKDSDVFGRRKVAVIGPAIVSEIFGQASPIGERFKLRGTIYTIIGVIEQKGSFGPFDLNKRVVIPITTAQNMVGTDKIMRLLCYTHNEKEIKTAVAKTTNVLLRRYDKDDFHVSTQQNTLDIIDNILVVLTGIVSGIAAISLLVGGIGIMNIMLVAVNERIREIGIRKALGATRRDILSQFLIAAALISTIGGATGILTGISIAYLVMWYLNAYTAIPINAIIMALSVSTIVGIFFGVYPAMRASALAPVEALRYE
ncbi:MAG: ABC transporter permease [bacterium]